MEKIGNEERIITLREIMDLLAQHLNTIVCFIAVFFCLSLLTVFFKPSIFQSKTLLKVSSESNNGDSLLAKITGGNGGNPFTAQAHMASQQYILTSETVLQNAVQSAHLDIVANPWFFPLIGRAFASHHTDYKDLSKVNSPVLWLSRYNWGGGYIQVSQFSVPEALKGRPFTLIYRGGNQYQLYSGDTLVLQGMVGQPVATIFDRAPLQIAVASIAANVGAHFLVKQLPLNVAVAQLRGQLKAEVIPMTNDLLQVTVSGALNQDLQKRLSAVVDSAIQLSIQLRIQKAKKILDFLQQQVPVVKGRLDDLNQSMNNTLPMGAQFSNISREKSIQNLMYTNMLMDIEQYELQKASSLGEISIITPSTEIAPQNPIGSMMMLVLGVLMGALLGSVYVFARHFVFGIVYSNEQLERVTGLSVVGALSISKQQVIQRLLFSKGRVPHLSLLSEKDENDIVLEAFRSARTHLFLNHLSDPLKKIITITGPIPNIGKSFVTANLAQQLAHMNKKVLLIDADIRKGAIWEYFCDARPSQGFVDLLKNFDMQSVIRKTRIRNLDFLPSGELNVRHVELLLKERVGDILKKLSEQYDYILIDTAPVFAVSDALGVCRHADLNLLVFAYGKHNERDVDECVRKFESAGVKLHGAFMNMIALPTLGYKYGYYKYGYRYGGYGIKEREKV